MAMTARAKRLTWWVGVPGAALAVVTLVLTLLVKPTVAAEVAPIVNRVTALEKQQESIAKSLDDLKDGQKQLICLHMPGCYAPPRPPEK